MTDQMEQFIRDLEARLQQQDQLILQLQNQRNDRTVDPFWIPDSIKMLQTFNGNKRQLPHWLSTGEQTLNRYRNLVSQDIFSMYEQAVINKLEKKARDVIATIGNPTTFSQIKEIRLLFTIVITTKHVQNIKTLAKQNPVYNNSWEAVNAFIDEDGLAAFICGLQKPLFGFVQASKPSNVQEARLS